MKNAVLVVTLVVIIHNVGPHFGMPFWMNILIFVLSGFFMLWMVIGILKHDYISDKTFDEAFYEDFDGK